MSNVSNKIAFYLLFILCLALGASATAQSERPENWGAVALGLTSFDAQVGWYDLGGSPADVRIIGSYAFQGGLALSTDVLWMTKKRSGFYAGGGFGVIAPTDFEFVTAGAHFNLGGDIPINQESGIVIDSSLGFYPVLLLDNMDPEEPGMFVPVFFRLGVGYRWTF